MYARSSLKHFQRRGVTSLPAPALVAFQDRYRLGTADAQVSEPASHSTLELLISRAQAIVQRCLHPQITRKYLLFLLLCSLFPTWHSSGLFFFFGVFFFKALTTIWYNIS